MGSAERRDETGRELEWPARGARSGRRGRCEARLHAARSTTAVRVWGFAAARDPYATGHRAEGGPKAGPARRPDARAADGLAGGAEWQPGHVVACSGAERRRWHDQRAGRRTGACGTSSVPGPNRRRQPRPRGRAGLRRGCAGEPPALPSPDRRSSRSWRPCRRPWSRPRLAAALRLAPAWFAGLDPRGWRTTIVAAVLMVGTVFGVNLVNAAVPLPSDGTGTVDPGPAVPGPIRRRPGPADGTAVDPGPVPPGTGLEVGSGVVVYPPDGWTVVGSESGQVVLQKGGGGHPACWASPWTASPLDLASAYRDAFFDGRPVHRQRTAVARDRQRHPCRRVPVHRRPGGHAGRRGDRRGRPAAARASSSTSSRRRAGSRPSPTTSTTSSAPSRSPEVASERRPGDLRRGRPAPLGLPDLLLAAPPAGLLALRHHPAPHRASSPSGKQLEMIQAAPEAWFATLILLLPYAIPVLLRHLPARPLRAGAHQHPGGCRSSGAASRPPPCRSTRTRRSAS